MQDSLPYPIYGMVKQTTFYSNLSPTVIQDSPPFQYVVRLSRRQSIDNLHTTVIQDYLPFSIYGMVKQAIVTKII